MRICMTEYQSCWSVSDSQSAWIICRSQLSGGEQSESCDSARCVHRPKVVFADEPTGALDTAAGFEVMRLFRELIDDEDITIVMTTHDPNLMELGDEVFELSDGIVI